MQKAWCVKVKIVSMELVQVNTHTIPSYLHIIGDTVDHFCVLINASLQVFYHNLFDCISFFSFLPLLDTTGQNSTCDMLVMKCKYLTWQVEKKN